MKIEELPQFTELSIPEKILFLEDLWDSIAADATEMPVPQFHQDKLDRRFSMPGELLTIEELQARINQKK
jgi:putative addiction module component (TIGR02574 family)